MNKVILFLLVSGVGFAAGTLATKGLNDSRHTRELEGLRAAWAAEKADWEDEVRRAEERALLPDTLLAVPTTTPPATQRPTATDIIARLQSLRPPAGGPTPSQMRAALYWMEELVQIGPEALPAIREFLARYQDLEFDTAWFQSKSAREGRLPGEFILPPSLRLGLFDVVRRIGGDEAENILATTLETTGRGLEVAYLSRLLQEMAPGVHRNAVVSSARALLAGAVQTGSSSPLDLHHRAFLFGLLTAHGETGYAYEAQSQLVRGDNQIDRPTLKYLQQALGPQAVPVAAQAYQNPTLATNAVAKEPLARLALNYVGVDAQADEFYQLAINDPVLTRSHRSNLIEDLNETGFANPKNLTTADLPLIESRLALIERLAPHAMDGVNAAAFKEAHKDLVKMRARVTGQTAAVP